MNVYKIIPANLLAALALALNAAPAAAFPVDATSYFASFGVTLVNNNPVTDGNFDSVPGQSDVAILNYFDVYAGTALTPVSSPNLLMQYQSHRPVSFTLQFADALTGFGWTIPGWAAPSAYPQWSITAYDGATIVGSDGAWTNYSSAYTHTIIAPHITSVTIASDNHFFAAFGGLPLDNLVLTTAHGSTLLNFDSVNTTTHVPEPALVTLLGIGLLGFGLLRRHKRHA